MFNQYYQRELSRLRELAVEFSKAHPALAPMLSGATQDPDVERLLEGTAFLTGMLRQKLDDEFPEIIHGLMSLIFPHYLRPLPATSIIAFTPKTSLMETLAVPSGTALDSVVVDGTKCRFQTSYDVDVHPLSIVSAQLAETPGLPTYLTLRFRLQGVPLENWKTDRIRLHIAGAYGEAANIYRLLLKHTRNVTINPVQGGSPAYLPPNSIRPVGLADDEALIPYPSQSFPGYRILQEYFILPQKFMFVDILGLDTWQDKGTGTEFEVVMEIVDPPTIFPTIKAEKFVLFATPVINLFPHDGDPIVLDHRQPEYRVIPSGGRLDHFQVYSVVSVTGFAPGTVQKREFAPFELFSPQVDSTPVYYVNRKISAIRSLPEIFLSVVYPKQSEPPAPETLTLKLMCTNANLPDNIKYGDISQQTSSSPELCEFKNIIPPTSAINPPLGKNVLWRFLSHLSLNLLSLGDTENLKVLLKLYIFPEGRDRSAILANEKRIDGIQKLTLNAVDRLVRGHVMRGQQVNLKLNPDHFASPGDMFLFGTIMDYFLGAYASINSYTQLTAEDALKGDTYIWPTRLGDRPLI